MNKLQLPHNPKSSKWMILIQVICGLICGLGIIGLIATALSFGSSLPSNMIQELRSAHQRQVLREACADSEKAKQLFSRVPPNSDLYEAFQDFCSEQCEKVESCL